MKTYLVIFTGLFALTGVASADTCNVALVNDTGTPLSNYSGEAVHAVDACDTAYAACAVTAGGAARAGLVAHQAEVKAAAAVILALVGARGLWAVTRDRPSDRRVQATTLTLVPRPSDGPSAQYRRFVGLTAINPLTLVYFMSVTASLSLSGVAQRVAFVAGVGTASALWHLGLALFAGQAGRRLTPTIQRAVSVAGRLAVVVMAVRLAIAV